MNKLNAKGFGVIEAMLILLAVGIIGGASFYVYRANKNTNDSLDNTGNSGSPYIDTKNEKQTTGKAKMYTPQEATLFTQETYDKYVSAIDKGNVTPLEKRGGNLTLPLYALNENRDRLTSDLYEKIRNIEKSEGGDKFGCATFQVDKYVAALKSNTEAEAQIDVNAEGLGGTIKVVTNLSTLKISAVACP